MLGLKICAYRLALSGPMEGLQSMLQCHMHPLNVVCWGGSIKEGVISLIYSPKFFACITLLIKERKSHSVPPIDAEMLARVLR